MIMLTWTVVVGLLLLGVTAVVIGIMDSAQTRSWRRIAVQRRVTWERRQHLLGHRSHVDSWGDEDSD